MTSRDPLKDSQYTKTRFTLSEKKHHYSPNVHLLSSPYHERMLARFSESAVSQPEAGRILKKLYAFLLEQSVNYLFPRSLQRVKTRMSSYHPEAEYEAELLDPAPKAVVVDLMRAGI